MCVANIHLAEFTVEKQNKDLELSINSLNRPYLDKDDNEENGNLTNGLFNFNGFDESDAAIVDEEKGSNWFNVANLDEVALDGFTAKSDSLNSVVLERANADILLEVGKTV